MEGQKCTFGLSGCRVNPGGPTRPGRWGSHTTTRELQTCTFERTGASNTTRIPRKRPKERKKNKKLWREREKKARNFGPPPFGPHLCFTGSVSGSKETKIPATGTFERRQGALPPCLQNLIVFGSLACYPAHSRRGEDCHPSTTWRPLVIAGSQVFPP